MNTRTPFLTNRLYDSLKFVAQILLPALGALYFGLAQIWHLPNAEEVVGTVAVVDTFLGVVLGLSSSTYHKSDAKYDGAIALEDDEETGGQKAVLKVDAATYSDALNNKQEVLFKVTKEGVVPVEQIGDDG